MCIYTQNAKELPFKEAFVICDMCGIEGHFGR